MEARGRRELGVRWDRRASMRRAGAACARRGVAPGRPVRDEAGRGETRTEPPSWSASVACRREMAAYLRCTSHPFCLRGWVRSGRARSAISRRGGSSAARLARGSRRAFRQPQPPRDGRAPPDDELLVGDVEGASDLAPRAELNQLTHDAGHRVCRVCAAPLPGRCVEWRPADVSDRLCRPRRSSRGGRGGATARSDSCWWLLYGAPVRIRDATSHEPWIRANSRPAARASALDRS